MLTVNVKRRDEAKCLDDFELSGVTFDALPPADALSWTFGDADGDGVKDLLVSDTEGQIWYYEKG